MNHRHRKILHSLFAHPVSANIDPKEVEAVLLELGATVDNRTGARIGVSLDGHTAVFHKAHHALPKEEVAQIRHFLERCGITPADYPV
ncbi:MAG: HicA protein [Flavobacteriaceae bacterium]